MDAASESRKKRKRSSRNEDETKSKKRINGFVEEETERSTAEKNIISEEGNTKDSICSAMQGKFDGKYFRKLLSTPNCLYALKKFVTISNANKEVDLAAEYLHANGSVLEILKLLDSSDRKNIDITTVFSAINILLMKILTEYPDHQNNAVESCRHLLNAHMSIIHSMLSMQSNAKQRKVMLKLLAAIVSLGSNLSRELLAHLSLQQQVLENLVRHSKYTDSESVRTCFIYFVLAFLVEGNTSVIKMLLDKNNLLSSIFPELTYDSKDIVNLVLTTVKTYVLENSNISKTIKLHAFPSSVVLNLISLYNWKGPSNRSKNENHSFDKSEEFLADKEVVNNVVHEFLLTLLTSHRYGIIFHDRTLGGSRNRHNHVVHAVLQNLEKPWEHEKPSDLVVKIMKACPDLIRSQYGSVEPFLEPRVSPKWICLLKFVKKVIESVDPTTCVKTCSTDLTTNNLTNTLLSLTVPSVIMKGAILPGLGHDSLSVRHEALTLFLVIIRQIRAISLAAKEFYKTVAVQSQITDFVLRTVPNFEAILRVWKRAFDANVMVSENVENVQNPKPADHLNIILSILHSYRDVCPELLDGSTDLQPSVLLTDLSGLETDDDGAEVNADELKRMRVKAIQFLLVTDTSIFAPGEKIFKETLLFLISLIREKATPESYDAAGLLLNATGLFESCDDQVDIWINGFLATIDPKEYEELAKWFMSVLKSAIKRTDKYINSITQTEGTINERLANFDVKKAKDIISELFNKANEACDLPDRESFTAESSLINKPNLRTKKNDNVGVNKVNEELPRNAIGQPTDKYMTQMNEGVINFHVKKAGNIINELLNKGNCNGFVNDVTFSTSALTSINGQLAGRLDVEKIHSTDDSSIELHEEDLSSCRMQACTSVSPLLCCALQKVNEKSSVAILAYLSYVLVHSLHHQIVPELLAHMATDLTNLPVYKYLQSWSSNSKPVSLKNKLPSLKLLRKVSNMLLTDTEMDVAEFSKMFDGLSSCCFKYGDKEVAIKHSLSLYDVRVLLKMTTFYLAQLSQREIMRYDQNEKCKFVLMFLLNIARSMDQGNNTSILGESAKCVFAHPILLHYFSPFCGEALRNSTKSMVTETILEICKVVVQLRGKYGDARIYNLFSAFRDKFLAQLGNIIENNPPDSRNNYDIAIELLRVLPLRAQEVTNLLLALMKLEETAFISSDERNLSVFGHIVPVLLGISCSEESMLQRDQYHVLDDRFVAKLGSHLIYLKSKKVNHVEKWERALATYLSTFPSNIVKFDRSTFARLLAKGVDASTIQLLTTLIARNTKLIPPLVEYFLKANKPKRMKQADVVFPILGSNLQHKWNDCFLRGLCECHADNIVAYLTDPQNPVRWIEENIAAVVHLIENAFELTTCEKTCDSISQSGDKLDMVSVCFVRLVESLYKRHESLITDKEKPLMDLIKILLHVMTATLKKESKNVEKLKVLCEKLDNTVICLRRFKREFVFSTLSKSYSWPQFTRFSLRLGLKSAENDEIRTGVLMTLSGLCDIAYEDNADDEYAKTLFEMATSHSEFVNIMLGSSSVKGSLVELLRILTRKNYSMMTVSHVPLYLAAYNATLSHTDQRILQLLQHYEAHSIKIQQYWPYLWGNAAAIRYSIRGEVDSALWRQPSTSEVFNLFDEDIVSDTIKNYPVHRALKDDSLYENSNVYDPAFYLPLLCSLLAENNVVACHKINHSGALALALAACCSDSNDVRMAAYTTISRYYFHLEASRSKEKLLWMRLIDALRNGVVSLKCPLKDVRLSCLVTTFLARTALVASQPLHPLYSPLHTFLMAKPALDLNTIPELLQLLHSSHVDHKAHRHWILENIRDGIKEENDIDVALKCVLFKMLLDFHTCALSDARTKKLILEVIVSTTKIPKSSLLLTRGYGVLPWLYGIINHSDVCEAESDAIITIIGNLLNSLDSLTEDTTHYKYLLLSILLKLNAHFPRNATNELSTRYANVLQRVIVAKGVKGCTGKRSLKRVQQVL
ncbi:PREDICTED: uncharacterized protein LOC106748083 [Dinoponera quadriceps]|uniref:Uncharacterized protein LOC106748083 n=1 Tax=Dinoponera quadriceps TaxID=609295 RepID=A0A6P3XV42_DINQU|nr:PREDICTED: uncharacterized protein LOC106748083 [Dinoponera quadriceps]